MVWIVWDNITTNRTLYFPRCELSPWVSKRTKVANLFGSRWLFRHYQAHLRAVEANQEAQRRRHRSAWRRGLTNNDTHDQHGVKRLPVRMVCVRPLLVDPYMEASFWGSATRASELVRRGGFSVHILAADHLPHYHWPGDSDSDCVVLLLHLCQVLRAYEPAADATNSTSPTATTEVRFQEMTLGCWDILISYFAQSL